MLVLAPHPDDEAVGCAGALLSHRLAGDDVVLSVVTDGRRSRSLGLAPEAMATQRHGEAQQASHLWGVPLAWLGLPEGDWSDDLGRTQIMGVLTSSAPEIVYAPSLVDFHPEHRRVARALTAALRATNLAPVVRVYAIQVPLGRQLANLVCDVSAHALTLEAAASAYASQIGNFPPALRLRRYVAARHAAGDLAEEFWELSAQVYAALHSSADDGSRFRGLRYLALSDPLAFVQGQALRRHLARASAPSTR